MTRKCKTPAKVLEALKAHQRTIQWISEVVHIKRTVPVENQASHVKEGSEAFWIGRACGANSMMEDVLHAHDCYAGFTYRARRPVTLSDGEKFFPVISPNDADYAAWRVEYNARA